MVDEAMVELKPCPFCGGSGYTDGDDRTGFFASCSECYACVGEAYDRDAMPEHLFRDQAAAAEAWNRRAALADTGKAETLPVAWRYRHNSGKWTVQKNRPGGFRDGMSNVELEPLYASALVQPAPADAAVVEAWQPIETAPKDGTLILVSFREKGVRAVSWDSPWDDVTPENGLWCVDDDKHGPYPLRGYSDAGYNSPTLWRPLPAPPALSSIPTSHRGADGSATATSGRVNDQGSKGETLEKVCTNDPGNDPKNENIGSAE